MMENKYQQLDSIVNSWWDSLPKEMQNELNKFYDNKMEKFKVFLDDEEKTVVANDLETVLELLEGHGYIVEKKEE
jgi:arginyl-tRNA synthetase